MLGRSRFRSRVRFGVGFNPQVLFAGGTQGAFYDPSDFSTLFQDSGGTTPVTAVEQAVRLMRDKSGRGNDATAPSDASRPVLRARYNLLERTEEFDNAAWAKSGGTITANAAVAPDGTTTADAIVENSTSGVHRVSQAASVVSGATYTVQVRAKKANVRYLQIVASSPTFFPTGNGAWFDFDTGTASAGTSTTASMTALADNWFLCSITMAATSTGSANFFFNPSTSNIDPNYQGINGQTNIYIWGAQLLTAADQTTTGGAYQRVGAATDYATGASFPPYLAFDGVDDSMSTSSVDFSATDEMTVFAGVTKLSDAARAMVVELSDDVGANNGTISLRAPQSASGSGDFGLFAKGTGSLAGGASAASFAAPITSVLTAFDNIGGDLLTLRANGSQIISDTVTDQGAGNFGNYPLFIGRRNNASLPFNGRIYSLIVLGRTATSAEIASTETWINSRTRAY